MCINVWVVLSSQQDKLKNHALNNIHNMASWFITRFWKPHLAFPYSPPSSGTVSTILYSLAPSNSCSLLFSLGNPWQKGGVFFSEDPSAKLGFLPLSSLRWDRQVAPRTSAAVSEPRCRHSPCLITLPLTRWNRSVMPTAGYLSALHSTHTGGNGGAALFM